MDPTQVKQSLLKVLKQVQTLQGEECPTLTGATVPATSLPKFDSKIWPVAAGILATELGTVIPPEANIFVDSATKQPLTIDQTVALVCKIVQEKASLAAVA